MSKTPKDGVWISKTGKLKVFTACTQSWIIEEGQIMKHPLFRIKIAVEKSMSIGWPVFEDAACLRNCEYLGVL